MASSGNVPRPAAAPATKADVEALLAEIQAMHTEIRRLCLLVDGSRGPRDDSDEVFLLVWAAIIGESPFTTAELFEQAKYYGDLARALSNAGLENAKVAGRLLQRLEGSVVAGGLVVKRLRETRDGWQWRIVHADYADYAAAGSKT